MYINIAASKLLILTHCTHMEVFLKEAEILFTEVNVTFEEYNEILQFDLKDIPIELKINEN